MSPLKFIYYGLLATASVTFLIFRRRHPPAFILLFALCVISIIIQATEDLLRAKGVDGYYIFHIYQPIEFVLLSSLYYKLFQRKIYKKLSIILVLIFAAVLSFYYFSFPRNFFQPYFFDFVVEAILISILVVVFFIQILQLNEYISLRSYSPFWVNAIHIIFYGGCLFTVGFYNYFRNADPILARKMLFINYFLNLILYASYTLIFICSGNSKTKRLSH